MTEETKRDLPQGKIPSVRRAVEAADLKDSHRARDLPADKEPTWEESPSQPWRKGTVDAGRPLPLSRVLDWAESVCDGEGIGPSPEDFARVRGALKVKAPAADLREFATAAADGSEGIGALKILEQLDAAVRDARRARWNLSLAVDVAARAAGILGT